MRKIFIVKAGTNNGGMEEGVSTHKKQISIGNWYSSILDNLGMAKYATELVKVVGDYTLISFYYLIRVGKYTVKGQMDDTKQTL